MCALAEPCSAADGQPSTCNADESQITDNDEINWDNPEYRTAEFRMYCFKVLPCTKPHHQGQAHHWTNCPYAHAGEHARRRDPRKHEYAAVVCPDLLQAGNCPRGESCHSAHSVFEFWLHPQRYRTQICREGPGCRRLVCFFAHSEDELREVQLPPVEGDPFAAAKAANAESMAVGAGACSSAHQGAVAAGGFSASPHAQQLMLQQLQQQQVAMQQQQQQQQQQMLQSEQLMILLDDQAAGAPAAPMLVTQGSSGLLQQQYVLHGTPQASAESMMPHHVSTTNWM
ncbi:hypothetical protein OEZ86_009930 [Tetradesmus obliquus]|uniref:C3H1-type domain-containing protein n=1 Tax=Tetradesmus obliquus TaxID=3088 RepID=A0ABY8UPY4_TETOB|nr:hypothetical protein OEZ85_001365 [Tetradesmus obliquus]WIA43467.1 hypothetical protein OEZ86_009930 [Tetradesmus obliquus]